MPVAEVKARYETIFRVAAGGMATVYLGTVRGAFGFRQLVAIKKPHAHLLADPDYRRLLITEARLASLIHHANVVDVRDVEAEGADVSLIMDYVEGAALAELLQCARSGGPGVAPAVAIRMVLDACAGLHAAHELIDERGRRVNLVHRDISPQNILVGLDGVARVTDFGIAKFEQKAGATTTDGHLKGKLAYMAPEAIEGKAIDRRYDVFAMGVVLWEAVCGRRLFRGENEADTMRRVLDQPAPPVSEEVPSIGHALDAVVATALAKSPDQRFDNARAMALALETSARAAGLVAGHSDVAELVQVSVGAALEERRARIRAHLAHEPSVGSAIVTSVDVPAAPTGARVQDPALPSTVDDPPRRGAASSATAPSPPPTAPSPETPPPAATSSPPAPLGGSTLRSADPAPAPLDPPAMATLASATASEPIQTSTLPIPGAPPRGVVATDPKWSPPTPTGTAASIARDVSSDAPVVPMTRFGWVGRGAIAMIAAVAAALVWMDQREPSRDATPARADAPAHADAPARVDGPAPADARSADVAAPGKAGATSPSAAAAASAKSVPPSPRTARDARRAPAPSSRTAPDPPPNPYAD